MPPLVPAAMAGWDRRAVVHDLAGETMGTVWRVRLAAPAGVDLTPVRVAIGRTLDGVVAEMSHWVSGSVLGRFNRAAAGSWTALPPDFATVIAAGLAMAERTRGTFDPAIGALVDRWGFGPEPVTGTPSADEVEAALAVSGWRRLAFDAGARRLRQPGGLRLDLSGIAKGFAVDRLAAVLAAKGHAHALIEIGGELVGRGLRPDGDPWWVELETPAGSEPLRVALHECAVATSGDYVRGRHTIDPRTGHPVEHALAVSVLHPSAMMADAWATALSVLPQDEGRRLAEAEGLAVRALNRTADGVREWISPALAAWMDGSEEQLA